MRVFRYMGFNPSEEVFIVVAQEWGGWGAGCGGTCSWVSYPPPHTHRNIYTLGYINADRSEDVLVYLFVHHVTIHLFSHRFS